MSKTITIRKGSDIKIKGKADQISVELETPSVFALAPTDFKDLMPKLSVRVGDEVKAGDPVFYDKDRPDIKICAPVSGEISEIRRGDHQSGNEDS